jgi:hypothetical protein
MGRIMVFLLTKIILALFGEYFQLKWVHASLIEK